MQRALHALFSRLDGQSSLVPMPESLRSDPKFASGVDVPFAERPQTRFRWQGAGGGRSLIACAHADVVKGGDWENALVPQIDGDRLIGRGAVDDKGMIVALFLALETLQEMRKRLDGDLECHFANEEEVGMAGALAFVRAGFRADGVLVCEPTDHNIYIAHRGSLQFSIRVVGKQAHLGRKRDGVNAIEKAAKVRGGSRQVRRSLDRRRSGVSPLRKLRIPRPGECGYHQRERFLLDRAGSGHNGGWCRLSAESGHDTSPDGNPGAIAAIDDAWIKDHVTVGFAGMKNDPYEMPQGHPLTEMLISTLQQFGRTPEVLGMMATCDARYYYNQGGMASIVVGGMNNGQAHAKYEYAELSDILDTAAEYALFFLEWCGSAS